MRAAEPPPKASVSAIALLDGIPQHGSTLGDPRAPVQLVEFADLQCPACAAVNTVLLPPLIQNYVRTGEIQLIFRDLHFIGPDSERLGRVAESMGLQNRLWQFVELAFEQQRDENTGYATDAYMAKLLGEIPGTDVHAALANRDSTAVTDALRRDSEQGDELRVEGTPSFFLVRPGQQPRRVELQSLTPSRFARELRSA